MPRDASPRAYDALDVAVTLLKKREGIDKTLKLARYAALFALGEAKARARPSAESSEFVRATTALERSIGDARRAYRLGKFLGNVRDFRDEVRENEGAGKRGRARWLTAAAACASAVANAAVLGKDLKQLCVERGTFAWRVRVDVIVLCDDGGAADCAVTAVMAALRDCVLPEVAVTRGKVALEGDGTAMNGDGVRKGTRLDVQTMPVCLTTALYREHLLVDPTREEEALSECEVSVVLTEDGLLRGVFKPGGEVEATEDTLMKCIAAAKLHYAASAKVVLEATEDEE